MGILFKAVYTPQQLALLLKNARENLDWSESNLRGACQDYLDNAPAGVFSNEMKLLSAVETVQDWQQRIRLIEKAQCDDRQAPIDLNLSGKWIDKVLGREA